jgi:hypothetical protein
MEDVVHISVPFTHILLSVFYYGCGIKMIYSTWASSTFYLYYRDEVS